LAAALLAPLFVGDLHDSAELPALHPLKEDAGDDAARGGGADDADAADRGVKDAARGEEVDDEDRAAQNGERVPHARQQVAQPRMFLGPDLNFTADMALPRLARLRRRHMAEALAHLGDPRLLQEMGIDRAPVAAPDVDQVLNPLAEAALLQL